ncbi:Hypothetical Protein RradSPS_2236 [Rubrobacter radiotolerans]|uniref:Yip1 domain n=1 Tax=Rubrobacter radiotolerans TaxID=42256 RepID=A0A023X647_RUBRA|nr:hypothetical protein [Rubrobacter radiotolerans]AHY47519.1 Hypothetical Protein RradSPS_2236 [Rubrobacter radiotolerans]MDX5894922.1 hypothetical protein [Rubrobacter radiotolerans]SMC07076.1 hypothetical protein SAMN00767673_2238 [Rubrobacter radiotolerans DSM 5868]
MAKRGYNRDTIRGGASDWDVSRPFSSYLRQLGSLLAHPVRFYEVLPKIPDPRAPGLFLLFSGAVAAVAWFFFWGWLAALGALLLTLPAALAVAGLFHLGSLGGRYGYLITWRAVAYPFGFAVPLLAVPVLRWVALALFVFLLCGVGLRTVQELSAARAFAVSGIIAALLAGALLLAVG